MISLLTHNEVNIKELTTLISKYGIGDFNINKVTVGFKPTEEADFEISIDVCKIVFPDDGDKIMLSLRVSEEDRLKLKLGNVEDDEDDDPRFHRLSDLMIDPPASLHIKVKHT